MLGIAPYGLRRYLWSVYRYTQNRRHKSLAVLDAARLFAGGAGGGEDEQIHQYGSLSNQKSLINRQYVVNLSLYEI
jgi:hypothetical protein